PGVTVIGTGGSTVSTRVPTAEVHWTKSANESGAYRAPAPVTTLSTASDPVAVATPTFVPSVGRRSTRDPVGETTTADAAAEFHAIERSPAPGATGGVNVEPSIARNSPGWNRSSGGSSTTNLSARIVRASSGPASSGSSTHPVTGSSVGQTGSSRGRVMSSMQYVSDVV